MGPRGDFGTVDRAGHVCPCANGSNRIHTMLPLSIGRTRLVFLAALFARIALLIYGQWQDANMTVKYTDVDYWVFTDAACAVVAGDSPFVRSTYRYTPLLAWLLLPNCWAPLRSWGKMLFCLADLLAGYFLLKILISHQGVAKEKALKLVTLSWLLNPLVFTISTRGNAESVLCCLILGTLHYVLQGKLVAAGLVFGLAVHLKLFPAIYSFALLHFIWNESWQAFPKAEQLKSSLSDEIASVASNTANDSDGSLVIRRTRSRPRLVYTSAGSLRLRNFNNFFRRFGHLLRFGLASLSSFGIATAWMLKAYGKEYLEESFLYHLTRKDHRHNFSPYFLPFYLESIRTLPKGMELAAFVPQLLLLSVIGYRLGKRQLPLACFMQTFVFVTFNKVCTSQYFLWYLCMLPFVLVSCRSVQIYKWLAMAAVWFGAQAIWLKFAFDLEFLGKNTFVPVWVASLLFMLVNTLIARQIIIHRQN